MFKSTRGRMAIGGVLLVVAIVGWSYRSMIFPPADLSNVSVIVGRVGHHMVLPTDETPALLTITDPSKVSTEFLRQSQIGDKVLVYQTHKRVIIYRPSLDRVVDVGPVIIETPVTSAP